MKKISREELERGKRLLQEAFEGRWRYKQFEIECVCENTVASECSNPECSGAGGGVPCTFVEAPEAYPAHEDHPQVVATIDVPGLSDLAEKNGEHICWLHNEALSLIEAYEQLLELRSALAFIGEHSMPHERDGALDAAKNGTIVGYAKSLGWKGNP